MDKRMDYVESKGDKNKKGTKGKPIDMRANYFGLKSGSPQWTLFQYYVNVGVDDDRVQTRKVVFKRAIRSRGLEFGYMFDGTQLFTAKPLEDLGLPLSFTHAWEKVKDTPPTDVVIAIKLVGTVDSGHPIYIQLHNLLIRKCMFGMELQEMGRNFFDPNARITLTAQRLELWPGKYSLRYIYF